MIRILWWTCNDPV